MSPTPATSLRRSSSSSDGREVRTVPFDYVITFPIEGIPGRLHRDVISISAVGTFVVTSLGYSLLLHERFGLAGSDDVRVAGPGRPGAVLFGRDRVRVFGRPGARTSVVLNGEVHEIEEPIGEDGSLTWTPPAGVEAGWMIVLDRTNGTTSGLIQTRFEAGGRSLVSLQFAPRPPLPGADRFQVVGSPGSFVTAEVFGQTETGRFRRHAGRPRLSRTFSIPSLEATEAARAAAEEHGINLADVVGTGRRGRIVRWDVDRFAKGPADDIELPEPEGEEGTTAGMRTVFLGEMDEGWLAEVSEDEVTGAGRERDRLQRLLPGDTLFLRDTPAGDGGEFVAPPSPELAASWHVPSSPLQARLSDLPREALARGFSVSPAVLERIDQGVSVPSGELEAPFRRCGSSGRGFDFLYSIVDNATGRAFQNEPVHNVAGLGIANGDRPFRQLPKPIVFQPRSVIRFEIEEIRGGPGTLYVVLQGYKVVGAGTVRRE